MADQESLWILRGQWAGELSTLSPPDSFLMEFSPISVQPLRATQALRDAHCPGPILNTLLVPFHPLTPKHNDVCYHICLSHLGLYQVLLVPCLLQLPPNFCLPGCSAGFVHYSLKFSLCLLPNYFLPYPRAWLCYCQDIQCNLLCSVLLRWSSNLHFLSHLTYETPVEILFLREGHYLNYQCSCLINSS